MSSSLGVAGVAALRQSCRSCGHPQPRNLATFDGYRSRVRPVTGAARGNAHASHCARCGTPMKVRIPGCKVDYAAYRCEKCGTDVLRSVPRAG